LAITSLPEPTYPSILNQGNLNENSPKTPSSSPAEAQVLVAAVIYNTSALAFVPLALTGVYLSTKAALH
jgi:hypothetical protein